MLTTQDIIKRLQKKMGEEQYAKLLKLIEADFNDLIAKDKNDSDALNSLYKKYVYPQIRQHGYKTLIKTRKIVYQPSDMKIFKYNSELGTQLKQELKETEHSNLDDLEYEDRFKLIVKLGVQKQVLIETLHYSLWMNGKIYHWGINSKRMYGDDETDREITNDWITSEEYDKIYFTLYSHDDLQKFCDEWEKQHKFEKEDDSKYFIKELITYMGLLEFST